uniref:Uncharacterized protein n=1 Tax=Magallana gigas TaxID=29159 RepID=K1R661_MAGGI
MTQSGSLDEAGKSEDDITYRNQQYDDLEGQGNLARVSSGIRLRENEESVTTRGNLKDGENPQPIHRL